MRDHGKEDRRHSEASERRSIGEADLARRNAKHDRTMAAGRWNDGEGERLDRIHPRM